jgi:hypothetical protein
MPNSIEVQGLSTLLPKLKSLPKELKAEVIKDVSDFSLEVLHEQQPPPNYVTRTAAYGKPFQSDRQRRWFFWALEAGNIQVPYHRTGGMANAWKVTPNADGALITNDSPGAQWVMGEQQSRHEKLVGWSTIGHIITYHLSFTSSRFRKVVDEAYQRVIRRLKLG